MQSIQRMFGRKNESDQNLEVSLNQKTCENQQLLSVFLHNATSQKHCISHYLHFLPSHSQFNLQFT